MHRRRRDVIIAVNFNDADVGPSDVHTFTGWTSKRLTTVWTISLRRTATTRVVDGNIYDNIADTDDDDNVRSSGAMWTVAADLMPTSS